MHSQSWTATSIKAHQSTLKKKIRRVIPLADSDFNEAYAHAHGFNRENALLGALKAHQMIESHFSHSEFVLYLQKRVGYITSAVIAELLDDVGFDISVTKRSEKHQDGHSDVAYDVAVALSNLPADILDSDIHFHIPEFGLGPAREPYRIDSNHNFRAEADYQKTRFGKGEATVIAKLMKGRWRGGFYVYAVEHQFDDSRCINSLKAALARAILTKLPTRVRCSIFKPDGYQKEVWRVEMLLPPSVQQYWGDTPFRFDIPQLPRRLFLINDVYVTDPKVGEFKNGVWKADFTSNGIEEDKNPTNLELVERELLESVNKLIQRSGYQAEGELISVLDANGKMVGTVQFNDGNYEAWKRVRLADKPGNSHTYLGRYASTNVARAAVLESV